MKKLKIMISLLMCLALLAQSSVVFALDNSKNADDEVNLVGEYVEGEAVVVLKDSADKSCLSKSKAEKVYGDGMKLKDTAVFTKKNGKELKVATVKAEDMTTAELIKDLKNNDSVKYVMPNSIRHKATVTEDTYSKFQWALDNTGLNGGKAGCDSNPEALWPEVKSNNDDSIVAVIDSGIDYTHEDLQDSLWVNPYGSKLKGVYGYDFSGENSDHSPMDGDGHGTHVAGIIAAQADNNLGISSINKSKVKIMSLKFLDDEGSGSLSSEISSFNYIEDALRLGANIKAVNCSYGGTSDLSEKKFYDELFDTLGEYGVVTCVASGNEFLDIDNVRNVSSPSYQGRGKYILPAETDSEYALTVGASNEWDGIAEFSNTGKCVDIAAPGTNILSTVSYYAFNPSIYSDGQRQEICKYYQGYETSNPTGFGKPVTYDVYPNTTEANVQSGKNSFLSNGGMVFSTASSSSPSSYEMVVTFPYTIKNTSQGYDISFMMRASGPAKVYLDDRAASFDAEYDYEDIPRSCWKLSTGSSSDWDHTGIYNESKWIDSTERQLILYIVSDKPVSVAIDDLAIAKQGADETKYGKYEFYGGTSMACPYVAGAVALVANARDDMDAYNIARAIKTTGRPSPAASGLIESGNILSLDNIMSYEILPEGKIGDCRWAFDKDTGTLTISGKGKTRDYNYSFDASTGASAIVTPWAAYADNITKVVIKDGVTTIGDGCFAGCVNLSEISIPSSVTYLGKYSLFNTDIHSINLPNNISTIRQYALGYAIYRLQSDSDSYGAAPMNDFKISAYTGSKTAVCLKANGYGFTSLGGLTLQKYSATVYVKGTVDVKPKLVNYSGKVTYTSSNTKIAKVSAKGKVTAVKQGTAKITVKCGELSQTFKVTVKNPKLNAASKVIKKGKSFRLTITGKVGKATFTSSNKKIAAVTSSGVIKAKAKGKATITVKTNGLTLKCKVTVK